MGPERELIRRITPFALPVAAFAYGLGALTAGPDAGWSAVIAVAIVTANFVASAWGLAWGASISAVVMAAVAMGGFVVRLGIIVAITLGLRQLEWFQMGAFLAALVPTTIALLVVEMKLLSGRMQTDLWTFRDLSAGPGSSTAGQVRR